jgi:hypothetical protein
MGIMQGLVLRGALGVGKIAERTCTQDGGIESEMELRETFGWAVLLTLVFVLWFMFRGRGGTRDDSASAFEGLGCVVER